MELQLEHWGVVGAFGELELQLENWGVVGAFGELELWRVGASVGELGSSWSFWGVGVFGELELQLEHWGVVGAFGELELLGSWSFSWSIGE